MSQQYIRELCVGHCYARIGPVSIIHMEDCPCASIIASANLDTCILNLHAQSRATVCTLHMHGNMYS